MGRHYGSIFDHFDVIGPEATKFDEITQNKGYYAAKVIQDHRFWSLKPIYESSISLYY